MTLMTHAKAVNRLRTLAQIPPTLGRRVLSSAWRPHSRLILLNDAASWVIDEEMRALADIATALGIRVVPPKWNQGSKHQSVFYGSQFYLFSDEWLRSSHRIAVAYFHGKPDTGVREFDDLFAKVKHHHDRLARVQVSHSEMRNCLLTTGIAPEKLHLIPIGINLSLFHPQTPALKSQFRAQYNIPQTATVIGSFQKDGVGWGDGLEPKLIKGPDTFVQAMSALKTRVPELLVVLSGPARGYVKAGLARHGIPFLHFNLPRYADIGELFQTLDLYMVTSRQEGGPKAVLESMASGIPLVTTRVGQAMDLVRHGENGWMTDVEDVEALTHWAHKSLDHSTDKTRIISAGLLTAHENAYSMQAPLWKKFLNGFVEET
jgi:glycosyltransferase involved in cell wall biosynthesis